MWKRKSCRKKVGASGEIRSSVDYLENERLKEPLGDFTLSEYNEKGEVFSRICCDDIVYIFAYRRCDRMYELGSKLKELVNLYILCKSQLFAICNKENSSN